MNEEISQEEVEGTWRRCLIQFVALDYATWYEEVGSSLQGATTPQTPLTKADGANPSSPMAKRSEYLFLQDLLTRALLYPRVLCELKRVVDLSQITETLREMRHIPEIENLLNRIEDLGQKIEALTGVRPTQDMVNLFTKMIQGFGSRKDTVVSENNDNVVNLFNVEQWAPSKEPPVHKKKIKIEELIPAAGLRDLIDAVEKVPGLICESNRLDIGIRDRILSDWTKMTDSKTWGARAEIISSLASQLPIVDEVFSTAKSSSGQEDFLPGALRVMTDYLHPMIESSKKDLESLLEEPTSLRVRNTFSVISGVIGDLEAQGQAPDTEVTKMADRLAASKKLEFLETALWIMSDKPYLFKLFEKVRSHLGAEDPLIDEKVRNDALFQGSLARPREITGKILLGHVLKRFKLATESSARLGVREKSKLAGGYSI